MASSAGPASLITVRTSLKSRLIAPFWLMMFEIAWIACRSTSSAISNAWSIV